jgi:hypothetical protein
MATPDGPGGIAMTDYAVEEYDADPYLWYQIIYKYGRHAVTEHIAKIIAGAPQSLLSTGSCKNCWTSTKAESSPDTRYTI